MMLYYISILVLERQSVDRTDYYHLIGPGPPSDALSVQARMALLNTYFQAARDEIVHRIGQRDSAFLVFLAAATAVFGVSFGDVSRPALLFSIAPLGLGASFVVAQHNDAIGALGAYCGIEVTVQAERILGTTVPDSWDTSASLIAVGPRKLRSARPRKGRWLSRLSTDRLYASLLLIVGPGIAGGTMGSIMVRNWWATFFGIIVDAVTASWATFLLWNSANERNERRRQLESWRKKHILLT
jgi:hypothetical protein